MRVKRLVLLLVVLTVGGCSLVSPQFADGIREGQKQYARNNYLGAERLLTATIAKDPRSPAVAEAYYIRGLARLKLRRKSLAEQDFQRALDLANRDDLKANVHVCIGSIAYEDGDWNQAYAHYQAAENNLPILSPSDWILFRLASSAQRSGRWEEGKKYFARILREYPNSDVARSARRHMKCAYFTIQTGAFSTISGAAKQLKQLKQANFKVRIEEIHSNGRLLQGVYVGRYPDYYQAGQGLERVKGVVPDARIVP